MKKQYNIKYRRHAELQMEIIKYENEIDDIETKIVKLEVKKKSILSIVDSNFYNQMVETFNRIPKELVNFAFVLLGFGENRYLAIRVSYK